MELEDNKEKKHTAMFTQMMEHKMLKQEANQRNISLQNQVAKLESSVDKLWYQLRQKNTHKANLRRAYLAEKKEIKALEENKVLKLEKELMKFKNVNVFTKDNTRLENSKLKENLRSLKVLHKEQLRLKDSRISDQNLTIKSLQRKISALEKSEAKVTAKFADFQRQSAANIVKMEHKKELFEIKEKQKKDNEEKKKQERLSEKEQQKKKLQEAIRMHQDFMPEHNKHTQGNIINNFRHKQRTPPGTYLPPPPPYGTQPSSYRGQGKAASLAPLPDEINDIDNVIHLTTRHHDPANVVCMIPNFMTLMNNIATGNVDYAGTSSDETSRKKKET